MIPTRAQRTWTIQQHVYAFLLLVEMRTDRLNAILVPKAEDTRESRV